MEKNDILQIFLTAGYQLNPDALNYFEKNPNEVKRFLDLASGRLENPTITQGTIDNILANVSHEVKVVKTFASRKGQESVEDLSNKLSKRYEKISEMMSKKPELTNLISINRIKADAKKFSVIGMLKEVNKGDRSLVVEDPTGSIPIYVSEEADEDFKYLVEDEVVGLVCDNEDSSENRATKIVFPDIPLSTQIKTSKEDIMCIFISDIHFDDSGFMEHSLEKLGEYLKKIKKDTIVFVLGDVSKNREKIKKFTEIIPKNFSTIFLKGELVKKSDDWLPDPVIVDVNGVKIFLSHGNRFKKYFEKFKISPEKMLLQLIKKRHLSPTVGYNKDFEDEKLLLDDVPDIFVIGHYHDPKIMNYKGVTLISLGSFVSQPIFWAVNLKTRETIKIDLT